MGTYIDPLDLKTIFVDYFLGSMALFSFFFIILLSYVSAKMQLSNRVFMILITLTGVLFAAYIGQGLYFFIILVLGLLMFKTFARFVS